MKRKNNRVLALGALCTTVLLLTTGCLSGGDSGGGESGGSAATDGGSDDGDKKVEILGAFSGVEGDSFNKEMAAFTKDTGTRGPGAWTSRFLDGSP